MPEREYLFTSESVTEGHPDKMCDQISDAVLDAIIAREAELAAEGFATEAGSAAAADYVRCAIECFTTTGQIVVGGEIRTHGYVDIPTIVRGVVKDIGYNRAKYGFDGETCGVLIGVHEQSPDIAHGRRRVVRGPARRGRRSDRPRRRGRPGHDVRLRGQRDLDADADADLPRAPPRRAPDGGSQGRRARLPAPRRQDPGHRQVRQRQARLGGEDPHLHPARRGRRHREPAAPGPHRARHQAGLRRRGHRVRRMPRST